MGLQSRKAKPNFSPGHRPGLTVAGAATAPMAQAKQFEKTKPNHRLSPEVLNSKLEILNLGVGK